MIRKPTENAVRWITLAYYIGCAQALVFLIQSGLFYKEGMTEHTHPDYSYHAHGMCHSMAYVFSFCLAWYGLHVALIILNKDALKQQWALRILGLPNISLMVMLIFVLARMYWTYWDHDEHFFAATMAFACSMFMFGVLNVANKIISIPFKQGLAYGRNWLYVYWFGVGLLGLVCHYSDTHIHDYFSAAGFLVMTYGVWLSKDIDEAKMM